MRKIIIIFNLVALSLANCKEARDILFRIDWGSKELGSVISQDVIVFSINDFSIIRPTEKKEDSVTYTWLPSDVKLRWAIVENIDLFDQINISSYGDVVTVKGLPLILNVKNLIEKQSYVAVTGIPKVEANHKFFELFKINGDQIDPIFYQSGSFGGYVIDISAPLSPGNYLLVIGNWNREDKKIFRKFDLSSEQIKKANERWVAPPASPEMFCGVTYLDFVDLNDVGAGLIENYKNKIPKISSLAATLKSYYSIFYPIPEFSFEYKKTLKYQIPFKGK